MNTNGSIAFLALVTKLAIAYYFSDGLQVQLLIKCRNNTLYFR